MTGSAGSGGSAALTALLKAGGHLPDGWAAAFLDVDRARYIPDRIWLRDDDGYRPVDRTRASDRWEAAVHGDVPVVVRVDTPDADVARVPTSSASMPRMVAGMLAALDVRDGQRVLEVGTGTGYNAALLCHRLGDSQVTSIEIDPVLAEAARARLAAAGWKPTLATGDGAAGLPGRAPYDRVVVTCALADVPYPLVEQTAPGGIVVAPWGTGLYNGVLVRLTVADGDEGPVASGPVIGDSAFMWMRRDVTAEPPARRDVMDCVHDQELAATSRGPLDPRYVLGVDDAAFAVGVACPTVRYSVGHGPDGEFTLWLADTGTDSWASVDYEPEASEFEIQQFGPRRVWDEMTDAYEAWQHAGAPARTRYGLDVGPGGRTTVWLDEPANPVAGARRS
ncbi:methyltransferase domain-containing protein [Streptomyces sp. AcH 505]|uniref:methyltransferase domain-containing protein n=1 Tax=Streptomyces sp. AcH 505 TaxID=352211 RepID=UPI0006944F2E